MCPSAPWVCSEPGGQKPVLSLLLDRIGPLGTLRNKLQWNFNQNTKFFIPENASENIVCEMVAILFGEVELTHWGQYKIQGGQPSKKKSSKFQTGQKFGNFNLGGGL